MSERITAPTEEALSDDGNSFKICPVNAMVSDKWATMASRSISTMFFSFVFMILPF